MKNLKTISIFLVAVLASSVLLFGAFSTVSAAPDAGLDSQQSSCYRYLSEYGTFKTSTISYRDDSGFCHLNNQDIVKCSKLKKVSCTAPSATATPCAPGETGYKQTKGWTGKVYPTKPAKPYLPMIDRSR